MMTGRPREFDRAEVLQKAVELFWERGYQTTSIDDLVEHMGIGRQSLYNTFGDKESLMQEVIGHYCEEATAPMQQILSAPGSPVGNIKRLFQAIVERCAGGGTRGCLMVNAAVEFAGSDPNSPILTAIRKGFQSVERGIRNALKRAIEAGELQKATDPLQQATFLAGIMQGMLLMSKTGASRETLERVAQGAMASLES